MPSKNIQMQKLLREQSENEERYITEIVTYLNFENKIKMTIPDSLTVVFKMFLFHAKQFLLR